MRCHIFFRRHGGEPVGLAEIRTRQLGSGLAIKLEPWGAAPPLGGSPVRTCLDPFNAGRGARDLWLGGLAEAALTGSKRTIGLLRTVTSRTGRGAQ